MDDKYYVDDIVKKDDAEYAVSAVNPDGNLTLIPLGKGMPKLEKPSTVSLVKSRIRELLSLKSFPDFIRMITNVESTYQFKAKGARKPKENDGFEESVDL